jgi:hypothetical protein
MIVFTNPHIHRSRRRRYLPATKREVDWNDQAVNAAQRKLFASKR